MCPSNVVPKSSVNIKVRAEYMPVQSQRDQGPSWLCVAMVLGSPACHAFPGVTEIETDAHIMGPCVTASGP